MQIDFLKLAGLLSFTAAVVHVAIVLGGPNWYRFFGAGEAMAIMAEKKMLQPTLITMLIAFVLTVWGIYAWSGAGIFPKLPFLKTILIIITSVYLVRGIGGLFAPFVSTNPQVTQNSTMFWLISSAICILFGMVHLKGVFDKWSVM